MNNWFIVLAVAVISGIIGSIIGGIAQDAIWMASEGFVPDCDKLADSWQELCREQNQAYYSGKAMIQIFGFIIPFVILFTFLKKLF